MSLPGAPRFRARTPADLIEALQLQPHPEGGFYRETYRSTDLIESLPSRFSGPRAASTGIYYLLGRGDFSAFHRIRSDEMWHFYAGDPLYVHVLHGDSWKVPGDSYQLIELGEDSCFQAVVPAGAWFAAEPTGEFALVGCTVAPGFDFKDFEMADRDRLLSEFPYQSELVLRLTR